MPYLGNKSALIVTAEKVQRIGLKRRKLTPLSGAFFWLSAFYLVYCARPEDWIPGLKYIPLAKITGVLAFVGLLWSLGKTQRSFRDLPREAAYLLMLIGVLFLSAFLSPIWRGGAFFHTLDFSKVYVAWVLTFLLVTEFERLRRIILIQSGSVAVIWFPSSRVIPNPGWRGSWAGSTPIRMIWRSRSFSPFRFVLPFS